MRHRDFAVDDLARDHAAAEQEADEEDGLLSSRGHAVENEERPAKRLHVVNGRLVPVGFVGLGGEVLDGLEVEKGVALDASLDLKGGAMAGW